MLSNKKIGQRDLEVNSIKIDKSLSCKKELYHLLNEGREAVKAGRKRPLTDVMKYIEQKLI